MAEPWEMTLEEFRKAHKATRCFQRYDHNARADRYASCRMGHRQREAIGEYFYVHDFAPGLAFPSQGQAVSRAHRNVVAQAIKDGLPVPVAVLVQYPDLSRLQTI
ncbi:MAG TPA: hypothetical protein VN519_06370 [Bryobacteraceae bacterium]|nr:hypothetical protein [Bryobacteraceae bacterium]